MTINEIINRLKQERDLSSRFPARIIFAEDLASYSALVTQLKGVCDVAINLARFCNQDVVPQFDKVREDLRQYDGKQILLLSVGEYLRLCIKRELNKERAQFPDFWGTIQQETSRTRWIMPVFACRDSFDRIIGRVDERQESFVWTLDLTNSEGTVDNPNAGRYGFQQRYNVAVYSPQFAGAIEADAENFQVWLRDWDVILNRKKSCAVVTRQYKNAEATSGDVCLDIIDSPFSHLCSLLSNTDGIKKDWELDEFWLSLIPKIKKGTSFSDLILELLGITNFDFVNNVIARWNTLDSIQRELVWLWYRINPTDEYYSHACKKAQRTSEIPERIKNEILQVSSRNPKWIDERMKAMQALDFRSFDEEYFETLDKLPLAETKLQLLTYKTHEERAFAIKTVSSLLRKGVEPEAIAEIIKEGYPLLSSYMSKSSEIDTEVDEYFSWYRKNKLINRFPGNYAKTITYDRFDTRLKCLNKTNGKDCFTLWIDGFGVEWLPVFLEELERKGIKPESWNIATAKLPTETEYNNQWDENGCSYEKWNKLDSYSHKGTPDDKSYYSCIAYQLSIFTEVAEKVDELLKEHEYVAITGDHGSSRLAALAFHNPGMVVTPPPNAKVRSLGRFCELSDESKGYPELDFMRKFSRDGKTYVVMKDYRHFSASGNAAGGNTDDQDVVGEIHGGDTPEERLVPVVIVRRSKPLPQFTCKPESACVFRKKAHIETTLEFNRKVSSLKVTANSLQGVCTQKDKKIWTVAFDGVVDNELLLTIVANGNLLPEKVALKVRSQGIERNAGMGGLP